MKEYEKCKLYRRVLLVRTGQMIVHNNSNFLNMLVDDLESVKKSIGYVDLKKLSVGQLKELGFTYNEENNIYLIPIWIYEALPEDN